MGLAVTTVAAGGLPVKELASGGGLAVTEVASYGLAVTKVTGTGAGMGVTFVSATGGPAFTATTFNPADLTNMSLSNGNLTGTTTGSSGGVRALSPRSSGKYYWEITLTNSNGAAGGGYRLTTAAASLTSNSSGAGVALSTGLVTVQGSGSTNINAFVTGETASLAYDLDNEFMWIRKAPAGNWNNSGTANPATGVGGISFAVMTGPYYPLVWGQNTGAVNTANFGASAFVGAVPSGFTAGWPV